MFDADKLNGREAPSEKRAKLAAEYTIGDDGKRKATKLQEKTKNLESEWQYDSGQFIIALREHIKTGIAKAKECLAGGPVAAQELKVDFLEIGIPKELFLKIMHDAGARRMPAKRGLPESYSLGDGGPTPIAKRQPAGELATHLAKELEKGPIFTTRQIIKDSGFNPTTWDKAARKILKCMATPFTFLGRWTCYHYPPPRHKLPTQDEARPILEALKAEAKALREARVAQAPSLPHDHGETIVLDWGLAKQFKGEDLVRPAGEASQESNEDAAIRIWDTGVGKLVGTPAFMSPEQARGEWS